MELTLEQARLISKLSREAVAKELKVNPATVYRWEIGKTAPDVIQFKRLCELYGRKMDDILVRSSN